MDSKILLAYKEQALVIQDLIKQFCAQGKKSFSECRIISYCLSAKLVSIAPKITTQFISLVNTPKQDFEGITKSAEEVTVPLSLLFMPEYWSQFWFKETYQQGTEEINELIIQQAETNPVVTFQTRQVATWLRTVMRELRQLQWDVAEFYIPADEQLYGYKAAAYHFAWAQDIDSFYFDFQSNEIVVVEHHFGNNKRIPLLLLAFSKNELESFMKRNSKSEVVLLPYNGYWHPPDLHQRIYSSIFYYKEDQCPEYFLNL